MRRDVSGRRRALGFPNMGNEPHKTAELLNITKLKELLEKNTGRDGKGLQGPIFVVAIRCSNQ